MTLPLGEFSFADAVKRYAAGGVIAPPHMRGYGAGKNPSFTVCDNFPINITLVVMGASQRLSGSGQG